MDKASDKSTPNEELKRLCNTDDIEVLKALAGNPNSREDTLLLLVNTKISQVLVIIAGRLDLTRKVALELFNEDDTCLISTLAGNPVLPDAILEMLTQVNNDHASFIAHDTLLFKKSIRGIKEEGNFEGFFRKNTAFTSRIFGTGQVRSVRKMSKKEEAQVFFPEIYTFVNYVAHKCPDNMWRLEQGTTFKPNS